MCQLKLIWTKLLGLLSRKENRMSTLKSDAVTAVTTNGAITITGNGSGKVKLGDGNLIFPDADGSANQYIKTDGSANLAFATLPAATSAGATILSTQSNASAVVNFTSIPSGVNWIQLTFWNARLSNTGDMLVQLGDSGGLETSGYVGHGHKISTSTITVSNSTTGMVMRNGEAGVHWYGHMIITRAEASAHRWVSSYWLSYGNIDTSFGGSSKTLSAELDRIRVTPDTGDFDQTGATISLSYM